MGLEHVGFLWYMRRISPWAALGFAAGMGYMAFKEVGLASQVVLGASSIHMFGFFLHILDVRAFYELMNFMVCFCDLVASRFLRFAAHDCSLRGRRVQSLMMMMRMITCLLLHKLRRRVFFSMTVPPQLFASSQSSVGWSASSFAQLR